MSALGSGMPLNLSDMEGEYVMGLFDKELRTENIIQVMLANAAGCLEDMPERAFGIYKQIVELAPDITAQYNLGVLYAQGKGTAQDFLQSAYWFHQAALNGDSEASCSTLSCGGRNFACLLYKLFSRRFFEVMEYITRVCTHGSTDIPKLG